MDNRETSTPSSDDPILKRHLFSGVTIKGRGDAGRVYFVRRPSRQSFGFRAAASSGPIPKAPGSAGGYLRLSSRVAHLERLVIYADVICRHVEQAGIRRECRWLLVLASERSRADALHIDVLVLRRVPRVEKGTAIGLGVLVHIDLGGPVDHRIVFFSDEELTVGPVECVGESTSIEMNENLPLCPADVLVGEDHLTDAVVVPPVVWRHPVNPSGVSGVDIAREDGHRPFVVARPLARIPGAGIGGAVVDQVELGVVGVLSTGRRSAELPMLAFPSLQARIFADRLAQFCRLPRINQHFVVRADRIGAPCLLAGLDVVGRHRAANRKLVAGDADKHLVLDHHRSRGSGLALRRVAVLD
jgi:hypothetical protein